MGRRNVQRKREEVITKLSNSRERNENYVKFDTQEFQSSNMTLLQQIEKANSM